jgi:fructokinase
MLNSAVSLGRAGLPVHLITDFGRDEAGNMIHEFLERSGVDIRYADRYENGKTSLALAFLDRNNNADFSFYKFYPKKRLKILLPNLAAGDILLFGSFFSLDKNIRPLVLKFVRKARNSGALVVYDPNFRRPHLPDLASLRPWIMENLSLADIVRGSDEDFNHIFGARTSDEAYMKVYEAGCRNLVYTRNNKVVEVIGNRKKQVFKVPKIKVASTVGAGDAFNAGLLFGLWNLTGDQLVSEQGRWKVSHSIWGRLIAGGISFAADVCMGLDNYISQEYAKALSDGKAAF